MNLKDYLENKRIERERELRNEARKKQILSAKNVAVGTVVGTIAGVAAGILLAPKSGEETRKDISDFADQQAKKTKDSINSTIENLKVKSDELSGDLKDKYQEYQDRNVTELHKLADDLDEAKDYVLDYINDANKNDNTVSEDVKADGIPDEDLIHTREELAKVADNIGKNDNKNDKKNK